MMKPVEDKIYAAVQQVAADEGYDVILDKSSQNIPYMNAKYDLTVKVLRKLGVDVDKLEKEYLVSPFLKLNEMNKPFVTNLLLNNSAIYLFKYRQNQLL